MHSPLRKLGKLVVHVVGAQPHTHTILKCFNGSHERCPDKWTRSIMEGYVERKLEDSGRHLRALGVKAKPGVFTH